MRRFIRGEVFTDAEEIARMFMPLLAGIGGRIRALETSVVDGAPAIDTKGNAVSDPDLRHIENVPLPAGALTYKADVAGRLPTLTYRSAIDDYMAAELHPYVPDAWVDCDKTKIGYEIPLTSHFYKYVPPRTLAEIDAEIEQLEAEIQELLREVTE